MENMIYTSKRGKQIIFDDFEDNTEEYGTYWGNMCPHCRNKYRGILGNRASYGGSGEAPCSVKGCENKACYYVDFDMKEVTFTKEYKVKYTDNKGCEDCIMTYLSEEEAEKAIEDDLENVKEYCQSLNYDYADFGNKTEFWVKDGDEYACWERLWK